MAERVGDQVRLTWNTPANSTDGDRVKGALSADICLDAAPSATGSAPPAPKARPKRGRKTDPPVPAAGVAPCKVVNHLAVVPGASQAVQRLDGPLAAGPPRLVAFRVQLLNDKGRSAGPSGPVYVAAGSAPEPVAGLTIVPQRDAALVKWQAGSNAAEMELKRTLVATAAGPVEAVPAAKPAPGKPNAKKMPPREVILRADAAAEKDAGGMIDPGVQDGDTYTYVAQRVRTVTLDGHTVQLRGEASPAVAFKYEDVFPPTAPTGLALVPGGGFGEAPSIDLAWEANPERDVTGYNVYRSDGGDFLRLNAEPAPAPAFRDLHVEPGHTYRYRVTAVDARHNESAPSAEVSEALRK